MDALLTDMQRRIVALERRRSRPSGAIGELEQEVALLDGRVGALESRLPGVIPSSVSVGSGSATVEDDGTVLFSGASSVSLNGVFDGLGADAYMIATRFRLAGAATVLMRPRVAGVDQSGNIYSYAALNSNLGGGPNRSATSTASAIFFTPSAFQADGSTTMHLYGPGTTGVWTTYDASTGAVGGGDRWFWTQAGNLAMFPFDGLTLFLGAATTMSGAIKVVKIG